MNLNYMNAHELKEMLETKKISSKEITESVFQRIDEVEDKVGAYITLCKEAAIKKSVEIDNKRAAGENLAPLAGIPIGIKDNICTEGVLTTCASKMLNNFVPPYSATVVKKLEAAGLVPVGKLNMDEFAMGSSSETSYFKRTHNPFDLERIPGGSSGGSAAAVAAGEAILSLGSDTGGSIRQPASHCGIVGFKPTYGAVSRYGLIAFASSLDQIGPFARCIKDATMLFDAISGKDEMDSTSLTGDYLNTADSLTGDVSGKTLGVPKEFFGEGIDDDVKNSVMEAVKTLEAKGAKVKEISLPLIKYGLETYYIISSAEASSNLARFDGIKYGFRAENFDGLIDLYKKTRSEGFGAEVKRRIMLGTFVLSSGYYDAYYKRAQKVQRLIKSDFEEAFKSVDAIVGPTTPNTAFKIGENINDPLKMYLSDIYTVSINIAGLPALVLPCGKDKNNMPIGLQLIGNRFSDRTLFDIGYAYEQTGTGFEIPKL